MYTGLRPHERRRQAPQPDTVLYRPRSVQCIVHTSSGERARPCVDSLAGLTGVAATKLLVQIRS